MITRSAPSLSVRSPCCGQHRIRRCCSQAPIPPGLVRAAMADLRNSCKSEAPQVILPGGVQISYRWRLPECEVDCREPTDGGTATVTFVLA